MQIARSDRIRFTTKNSIRYRMKEDMSESRFSIATFIILSLHQGKFCLFVWQQISCSHAFSVTPFQMWFPVKQHLCEIYHFFGAVVN